MNNQVINLLARFQSIRKQTEKICSPLQTEDYVVQPIVDVSPPKWHLGHTTWFFEEFFLKGFQNYKLFDDQFAFVFNSYYENVGTRVLRTDRGNLSRPSVEEIYNYRKYVDSQFEAIAKAHELSDDQINIIEIGLNHEQQHQELLVTDIKYILGNNPLFPAYGESRLLNQESDEGFAKIDKGLYEIGYDGDGFCYDNELGKHSVYLEDLEMSKKLVTNREFIQFIQDGAYKDSNLWHAEAWDWIAKNDIQAPQYWHLIDGKWHYYTLQGLREVDPDLPVTHISYFEAFAFAEWKGMRLPTEFEWEVASDQFEWGQVWEWTESAYLPYPGYQKADGALGEYNGKFMVNQKVLRGGSIATAEGHSRKTYRNFFHANLRWQFTGIRLVKK